MLIIEVRATTEYGLEVYKVLVNGTIMNTYLSLQFAEAKKKAYLKAWNIDKIYKKAS